MAKKTPPKNRDIVKLAEEFDGPSGLARVLGIQAPTVHQWINGARHVPPAQCVAIECQTGGKWTVERLCPNQKWVRVRDENWPHPDGRPALDLVKECEQKESS